MQGQIPCVKDSRTETRARNGSHGPYAQVMLHSPLLPISPPLPYPWVIETGKPLILQGFRDIVKYHKSIAWRGRDHNMIAKPLYINGLICGNLRDTPISTTKYFILLIFFQQPQAEALITFVNR